MKIVAFAGSNSKKSINKQLATYAASLFDNADVEVLDLNDYEMPIFSIDDEKESGQPKEAQAFLDKIAEADFLILSLAENNGNYSAAFKNVFDWSTRLKKEVFQHKPMLLMATSPGGRGGKSVLELAEKSLAFYGGNIKGTYSLPEFYQNFDEAKGIISSEEYNNYLKEIVQGIQKQL
ncbi:NADPH-dependent FMN reductase [Flavobacterium sp. '19STA2R22 D10 B1']|uniref:NADPH-dependent FMN reductase n=1 Tax=Flavobacterium aerium TaxID=3037261 RepID=UPI00278BB6AD|nr:NAD(P)H-dependent oxidoreductase [Flavobacterium sp. '19STA2R22 D10 B1']